MRFLLLILFIVSCNAEKNKPLKQKNVSEQISITVRPDSISKFHDTAISINTNIIAFALKPVPVSLAKGLHFNLNIPEGYQLAVAAEGLKRPRFLAMSPDKRLFVTDMYDRSDNQKGRVFIFENWNDSAKRFNKIITYLDGLHNPNQVEFYKNFIYVAETDKLTRYTYNSGDNFPADSGKVITEFPAYGLSYKYGGWHLTRSITFHHDKLYVSVGSSCNACIETEDVRASIIEMNADGSDVQHFAKGVRNAVGLKWIGNQLWATGMGRDLIGPDKPEDLFQQIERDGFYGWPYYFQYRKQIYEDKEFKDSLKPAWVKIPPVAFCGFKAHSAPLGFDHLAGFKDTSLNNSVLVCLHGSTSVWRERGNAVVKIGTGNQYTEVVSGFLTGKTEADRHGRPCDIMMNNDHSFFITDDLNGVLYYVWRNE